MIILAYQWCLALSLASGGNPFPRAISRNGVSVGTSCVYVQRQRLVAVWKHQRLSKSGLRLSWPSIHWCVRPKHLNQQTMQLILKIKNLVYQDIFFYSQYLLFREQQSKSINNQRAPIATLSIELIESDSLHQILKYHRHLGEKIIKNSLKNAIKL